MADPLAENLTTSAPASAAAAAATPPLEEAGFAHLHADDGSVTCVRKYEISLGRRSKQAVDVVLGDSMSLSRLHARIYWDFEGSRWELEVLGKNGEDSPSYLMFE